MSPRHETTILCNNLELEAIGACVVTATASAARRGLTREVGEAVALQEISDAETSSAKGFVKRLSTERVRSVAANNIWVDERRNATQDGGSGQRRVGANGRDALHERVEVLLRRDEGLGGCDGSLRAAKFSHDAVGELELSAIAASITAGGNSRTWTPHLIASVRGREKNTGRRAGERGSDTRRTTVGGRNKLSDRLFLSEAARAQALGIYSRDGRALVTHRALTRAARRETTIVFANIMASKNERVLVLVARSKGVAKQRRDRD